MSTSREPHAEDGHTERTPLVKDRANPWIVCRPVLWLFRLQDEFGLPILVTFFATMHLLAGFVYGLVNASSNFLMAQYGVPAATLQIYGGVWTLPNTMKPIIGMMSDSFPIFGYNKTSYMLIAVIGGGVALAIVACGPSWMNSQGAVLAIFSVMLMISTVTLLMEAMYAKLSKRVPDMGPDLLTFMISGLQLGSLVATQTVGLMLNHSLNLPYIVSLFPVAFAIFVLARNYMGEERVGGEQVANKQPQAIEISILCALSFVGALSLTVISVVFKDVHVNLVAAVSVMVVLLSASVLLLKPIVAKVNVFYAIQSSLYLSVSGASFYFYIDDATQYPEGPHFSIMFVTSVLGVVASLCSLIGMYMYNAWGKTWKYRSMIYLVNVVICILNLADSVFYSRLNVTLGIPDHVFVIGSSAMEMTVIAGLWMPAVVMLAQFCPKGMEASMYALISACHSLGSVVSRNCGAVLIELMGVKPMGAADESAQFANLWKCSAIAAVCPLLSLMLVPALIPDAYPTDALLDDKDRNVTDGSLWKRIAPFLFTTPHNHQPLLDNKDRNVTDGPL